MTRICLLLAVLAGAVAGLLGCGGDGRDDGETAAEEQPADTGPTTAELRARVKELVPIASASHVGQSMKEQIKAANAEAELAEIAGKDLAAVQTLLDALRRGDQELIGGLSTFYVQLGKPGSEPVLAATAADLYATQDIRWSGLPFELIGTGNDKLDNLVKQELEAKGFTVTGSIGAAVLGWGSSGAYGKGLQPDSAPPVQVPVAPPPTP